VAGVHAQDPGAAIRASIPFDFIVEGKTLPAGEYEIRRINDEPMDLLIQNVDHRREETMFQADPREGPTIPNHSLLIFHRYGDSCFLSEVMTAGEPPLLKVAQRPLHQSESRVIEPQRGTKEIATKGTKGTKIFLDLMCALCT
jgi:hypothetical protein